MRRVSLSRLDGFTLLELLLVVAMLIIVMGIAVPLSLNVTERMRLNQATREIERELHTARLKSVSVNSRLQVRLGCPVAGQYRIVEVMGTATDTAASRCDETAFPSPGPRDGDPATPAHDGPIRYLSAGTTLAGTGGGGTITALEFAADGQVREISGGAARRIAPAGVNFTVARGALTATLNINGLGRIQIR
jgi:type II secretory pathway pseudopilin PulG